MKICVIGNSHVGSLSRAWSSLKDGRPDLQMVFFAAPRDMLKSLLSDNHGLYTEYETLRAMLQFTSGGQDRIEPAAYDRFLIYGANLAPWFHPLAFHSARVIAQSVENHVSTTLSFQILRLIRGLTDKDVYLGHDPLPSPVDDLPAHRDPSASIDVYIEGVATVNRLMLADQGAELLPQPIDTIVGGRFTASGYARGSKRLLTAGDMQEELHPPRDRTHMNEDFGRRWLDGLLERRFPTSARESTACSSS